MKILVITTIMMSSSIMKTEILAQSSSGIVQRSATRMLNQSVRVPMRLIALSAEPTPIETAAEGAFVTADSASTKSITVSIMDRATLNALPAEAPDPKIAIHADSMPHLQAVEPNI